MNTVQTQRRAPTATHWISVMAAALVSAVGVQGVQAAPAEAAPSLVVHYDARSLATDGGVRTLYRRLESAARQVCPEESSRDLTSVAVAQQCREAAVARAIRDIDNPRLAQIVAAARSQG